jgi:hypothetical protein
VPELSRERISYLSEILITLLDAADLDDDDADTVCEIFIAKLWRRSGMDMLDFHAAMTAPLRDPSKVPLPVPRH